MKAMILAAGLGTRLKPLTDTRPKALVTVAGQTMLEIALARLHSFGIRDVIVNVHHFADLVVEYLRANDNFGMRIAISREQELLDTGGGLKKAAWFFLNDTASAIQPFILHNVDVISTIDLDAMVRFHKKSCALATLAVRRRETSRVLLFDRELKLCGRRTDSGQTAQLMGEAEEVESLAFSGVHVISPEIFAKISEHGAFSIIACYLRLAREREKVLAYRDDDSYWSDLGTPESVARAAAHLEQERSR